MKQKMIVSNVRIPEFDWLAARMVARELKMSMNQFLYNAMQAETKRLTLGGESDKKKMEKRATGYAAFDALLKDLKRVKGKPMGVSDNDKIIYGIDD